MRSLPLVVLAVLAAAPPARAIAQWAEEYYVRRAYSVTLRDVKRFDTLVEAALDNGANRGAGTGREDIRRTCSS
jgi:hypothetical protein